MFGSRSVSAGSLHCDVWEGQAADLAARDLIAIYPVAGWWRDKIKDRSFNKLARYCLVLSMDAGDVEVDLYTEIENQVNVPIEAEILIES
jgi:hypothetical protein